MTRADPLARAVFALLVFACFAAFFVTQRLKHTPTALQAYKLTPFFVPGRPGPHELEAISFKLARADAVTVTIIDSGERVVATLVQGHRVDRYKQLSLRWDGRSGAARRLMSLRSPSGRVILEPLNEGPLAAPGEYRVRVSLTEQGRSVVLPRSFNLVRG